MVWKCCGKALAFGRVEMGAAITQVVGLGCYCCSCGYKSREEGAEKGHLFSVLLFFLCAEDVSCVPENTLPDKT